MKNLTKLFVGLLLVAGVTSASHASVVARMPKAIATVGYTNVISSVTTMTLAAATSGYFFSGAIYELNLSSGTAGDFLVLVDSNNGTGYANGAGGSAQALLPGQIGPRFTFGTTSSKVTFDPPIFFEKGLMAIMSASIESVGITYEVGRGISGQ